MKKSLILGILGIAVTAGSSFAQGVIFGNYTSNGQIGGAITTSATPGTGLNANEALGSNFGMQLYYNNGSGFVAIGAAVSFLDGAGYAGYTSAAPTRLVPGWTVGSGPVTFEYVAFNTVTVAGYAPGVITGHSNPFTMTPADQSLPVYPDLSSATGYQAFTVSAPVVPEPSTLALAGLGLAALVAYRRKQA